MGLHRVCGSLFRRLLSVLRDYGKFSRLLNLFRGLLRVLGVIEGKRGSGGFGGLYVV